MKLFFYIVLLIFCFQRSLAETPSWYEGSLVLKTNQVLKGQIAVETAYDMILFKTDDQLLVYTADKIQSFYFYDGVHNINRKFVSLQKKIDAFTTNYLYEVVVYGEIKILRRLMFPFADADDHKNGYRYFIHANNELTELNKFSHKVFPVLLGHSDTLYKFVEEKRLNPHRRADIIRIVEYYNRESRMKSLLASR